MQGSKIQHQVLQSHHADINHSLLLIGYVKATRILYVAPASDPTMWTSVLATLLPTAFFASLERGDNPTLESESGEASSVALANDFSRGDPQDQPRDRYNPGCCVRLARECTQLVESIEGVRDAVGIQEE